MSDHSHDHLASIDNILYSFQSNLSGLDIVTGIVGPQRQEEAAGNDTQDDDIIALEVDGGIYDLRHVWHQSFTGKWIRVSSLQGLNVLRHDGAHILAHAVKELFPETQVTIGPTIDDGFYYDFFREASFTADDLQSIESRMHELIEANLPFKRQAILRDKALELFDKMGESFKKKLIHRIPEDQTIVLYSQGDFIDLCRGPHGPSTGRVGHFFKLTKVHSAYWHEAPEKPILQRIYGTLWLSQDDLDLFLKRQQEAALRDHRRLGREMNLFHLQEEGAGSVFWHPRGWNMYQKLVGYMRRKMAHSGYHEVKTPEVLDQRLWEVSGHWEKFQQHMFTMEKEDRSWALKPMNCPCHIEIFKQGIKSYRDLPYRMSEFGSCVRYEPSGSLMGLMRLRSFVQDDAHIFCQPHQIVEETQKFCHLLSQVYADLGIDNFSVAFSTRPHIRAGSDEVWDRAEEALRQGADAAGLQVTVNPGDGAFYGPKLEFVFKDALGRSWQCGTLQADFVLPQRFNLQYVGEDGQRHMPIMLHRAILGSVERFLGILLEHTAGRMPLWLAPLPLVVATITTDVHDYADELTRDLPPSDVVVDARNEKIGYKIREWSAAKVPLMWVIGRKEAQTQTVTIRNAQGESSTMDRHQALALFQEACRPPR